MGKLHKDIAMAMVQLAEEESTTDQDIIKVSAAEKLCVVKPTFHPKVLLKEGWCLVRDPCWLLFRNRREGLQKKLSYIGRGIISP